MHVDPGVNSGGHITETTYLAGFTQGLNTYTAKIFRIVKQTRRQGQKQRWRVLGWLWTLILQGTACSPGMRQTFLGKVATDCSQPLLSFSTASQSSASAVPRCWQGKHRVEGHAPGMRRLLLQLHKSSYRQKLGMFLGNARGTKLLIRNSTTGLICECYEPQL